LASSTTATGSSRWSSTNGSRCRRRRSGRIRSSRSRRWSKHPQFNPSNPNRLRSVAGAFGMNQWAFHHGSGRGYRLLADLILAADKLNPQVAARLVPPFGRWRGSTSSAGR
jgi:aminopeptidase N